MHEWINENPTVAIYYICIEVCLVYSRRLPVHLISAVHEWINEIPTVPIYYISRSNLHPPFTRSCIVPGFPHHNRRSRTLSYLSPARSGFPHRNCARRKRATHSPVGQIYTRRLPALVRNSSTQRANGFAAP